MKTFTSILAFLIVSTTVNAQFFTEKIKGNGTITTKTRTISDYDKISVAGSFDVKLIKGKEGNITIKADENLMDYIETEVTNGNLKIKPKKGYELRTSKTIELVVPFETIEGISLAGSGDIHSTDMMTTSDLKLSIAGSGNINLHISTKNLSSSIAGSGNIYLNGNSDEFKCSIAGSGNINAYNLKADVAKIEIAGSGNVKINAVNEIHASSVGSGDIYYTGNPTIEKIKSVGSGSIRKKS